jgi:hypothetical protein
LLAEFGRIGEILESPEAGDIGSVTCTRPSSQTCSNHNAACILSSLPKRKKSFPVKQNNTFIKKKPSRY